MRCWKASVSSRKHPRQRQPRAVEGDGEAEVAELGRAASREPDVPGLHVAVHDAARVRVVERLADLVRDADRLRDRETVTRRLGQEPLDVAARHVLAHDVGLARLLADVVDGDDVGMVAKPRHGLRLALDAEPARLVQALGLDDGKRDVTVEAGVASQIDALLPALAEEPADLVAAGGEGDGPRGRHERSAYSASPPARKPRHRTMSASSPVAAGLLP
jgi:hypothetical protein